MPELALNFFSVGSCPSSHKYAYQDGKYCCRTNKEKISSEGDSCDGSEIGIDSSCCANDEYQQCENERCINHKDASNGQGNVKEIKMIVRCKSPQSSAGTRASSLPRPQV